jgi:hypothetical protein
VPPNVFKKRLNQRPKDNIVEIYQREEMIEEQKEAFEKLRLQISANEELRCLIVLFDINQ